MKTQRKPDETRKQILDAAFQEIRRHGFQSASINDILARTGLTKGALYHHFPTKNALGFAVIDEVIRDFIHVTWMVPIKNADDPVACLKAQNHRMLEQVSEEQLLYGCPLNNLAQEMSAVDESFRERLKDLFDYWIEGIAETLRQGQARGLVRADADAMAAATFIVAATEGCIGLVKSARDLKPMQACVANLDCYLDALRP